ncbi:hypothetical protein BDZ97DRAFT_1929608 [Flammula alnicola]|nr:hypothetical protein BDZ97DRAFT_1929608 [Flammula alnicola]
MRERDRRRNHKLMQTPEYFSPDGGAERRLDSLAVAASVLRETALKAAVLVQDLEGHFVVEIVGTGGDGSNLFNANQAWQSSVDILLGLIRPMFTHSLSEGGVERALVVYGFKRLDRPSSLQYSVMAAVVIVTTGGGGWNGVVSSLRAAVAGVILGT